MTQQNQPQPLDLVRSQADVLGKLLALSARPGTDVTTIVAQELGYLEAVAQQKPDLLNCTPQSIVLAMRWVMKQNLSLDPYVGLVYVKTRSVNVGGQGQQARWVKVMETQPTANGLISINRQLGCLLDYTNPKVKKDAKGKVIEVGMKLLLPSYGEPRWEEYIFDESDFMRWRKASHKENSRGKQDADANTLNYANPNYTNFNGGIDPEFARAKCIRHSLKKLGTNPQEVRGAIRNVEFKQERVVDPNADEYTESDQQAVDSNDNYVDYEELNNQPAPPNPDLPNANDL